MAEIQWGLLANLGKNFVDSYDAGRKRRDEELSRDADREVAGIYAGRLGGSSAAPAAPAAPAIADLGTTPKLPTFAQGDRIGQYGEAIAAKESGGRYDAVGPTHPKLGSALGKYQVMEANVAPWTREALGRELTPQEFLANPQAQDAVFQHRFGKYVAETGSPEDAASMWFTGRPLAEGANKRDVLGTTGRAYVDSFRANLARVGGAPDLPATKVAMPDAAARSTAEADLPIEKSAAAQFQVPGQPALPAGVAGMAAQIQGMLNSQNPYTRKHGIALAEKHLVGEKYGFQVVGDKLYRTDPRTGSAVPIASELKPTSDIQEYNFYAEQERRAGRVPEDYTPWHRGNKSAGASKTEVNNTINGEKAYDQKVGGGYGETFNKLQEEGRKAPSAIGTLDLMEKLTQDPNFYSGIGSSALLRARQAGVALGIEGADKAAPMEMFQKLSNRMVLDMSGGSFGTGFSNADRDFVQGTAANASNTPEGNRQIIQVARKVEQRKLEIAGLARDYAKRNGGRIDAGFDAELAQWAEANPLFPRSEAKPAAPGQGQPGQAQGQMVPSFAAVPEGKRFRAPDGKVYRKVNGKAVAE